MSNAPSPPVATRLRGGSAFGGQSQLLRHCLYPARPPAVRIQANVIFFAALGQRDRSEPELSQVASTDRSNASSRKDGSGFKLKFHTPLAPITACALGLVSAAVRVA